jgi:putative nucleotidyltransferase with HDIG domain
MNDIPKEVIAVVALLKHEGFEAHLVGGCVRDVLMDRLPKDWDVTTNALPEDIQRIFPHTFYENDFGTVGVVNDETTDPAVQVIEVTPYRAESGYSDKRHPDTVRFGATLQEDLRRRDFTMNAIALDPLSGNLTDPHKGQSDIEQKIIRTVGSAEERFGEDALRIMRAVRLAAELDFELAEETIAAIHKLAETLSDISTERIRDEFTKLIMSDNPRKGIEFLYELHLLRYVVPELEEGVNVKQNQAHSYAVFEHLVRTLQAAADKGATLEVRLAALFHDIGKPATKAFDDRKDDWSFHGHDMVGSRLTRKRLQALRYPREVTDAATKLVRWHMFFSDTDEITHSAVRRLVRNVGPDRIHDIILLRICDRVGTGRPKEEPYRLRKYQSMVAEVMRDPISVSMLAIDGEDVMRMLGEKGGPRIGWILHALLEEVLDDPKRNTKDYLEEHIKELAALPDDELKKLGEAGKEVREEAEEKEVQKIRSKYFVE